VIRLALLIALASCDRFTGCDRFSALACERRGEVAVYVHTFVEPCALDVRVLDDGWLVVKRCEIRWTFGWCSHSD
jgi:hypothetical protein